MWNNEAAQLNSVPSGVVEKRVNKSCLTKARSHYSCRFATITDISFQDLPFARLSSSWNRASDFIKHVAVTLDSPGLCEGCVSHIYKPLSSLPFSLPSQWNRCECSPNNKVSRLTGVDHNVLALGLPPPSEHLSSLSGCQSEHLCTSVQSAAPTAGGRRKKRSDRVREQRDTETESGWRVEERRNKRRKEEEGGGDSPIHSFTPLLHFERSLVKVGQHGNLKFSQMPVEEVRSCGGLPSSLISLSFTASQSARSTSAAWQHRRFWDWATAIKHASRFQAWS